MKTDARLRGAVEDATREIFATLYDRYVDLYTKSPQQRYNELIGRDPKLFARFPLMDIASFLGITPTHLSRLRRNVFL